MKTEANRCITGDRYTMENTNYELLVTAAEKARGRRRGDGNYTEQHRWVENQDQERKEKPREKWATAAIQEKGCGSAQGGNVKIWTLIQKVPTNIFIQILQRDTERRQ